ncbi:MFS transporter [Cupriavidus sp. TMH.W2]|uniref:MFS transporter n=1 Tax=Cupriavidus sp. TMH.W2 TaxID=3434465 RepID=UPI003D78B1C4
MQSIPGYDLETLINTRRIGRFQTVIVLLCALVAMLDGFDTQAIAFVAPAILQEWHVVPSAFGPVFGAGLVGGLIGAIVFGILSDRIGRRKVLLCTVLLFSVGSLLTPLCTSVTMLGGIRLVTGIGLGGALPSFISLTSEYAPARLRATLVSMMFCGFPIGAVIGGLASAKLITTLGWASVFIIGGILPILLMPLLVVFMPESIHYLALRNDYIRVARIVRRMRCEAEWSGAVCASIRETRAPIRSLFRDGRAPGTVLLWITLFLSLLLTYFLVNWIPLVAQRQGLEIESAVHAVSMLNLGAVIGCIVLGKLADRFGTAFVISTAFALGSVAIALLGVAGDSAEMLSTMAFAAGCLSIGAQMCTLALCAAFYDTHLRATGIGWSVGVGRVGAIIGPVLGGILFGAGMDTEQLFIAVGATSLGASVSVFLIGRLLIPRARASMDSEMSQDSPAVPRHTR